MDWKDVRLLINVADSLLTESQGFFPTEESYYSAVLDKFNELKNTDEEAH